ncbi:hypothetical protein Btru_059617 [Bulinus truncatus]|nr:hypothetical protein Btru_059617 [Bulinus truncatus]
MLMKEVAMDELFICLFVLFAEYRASPTPVLTLNVILPFTLPALCYTINNNLAVFMQTQMDPATYVVLGNLKIVTTAILYKIIIRKKFNKVQWMAVSLLTCGGIINSYLCFIKIYYSTYLVYCLILYAGLFKHTRKLLQQIKITLTSLKVTLYLHGLSSSLRLSLESYFHS